MKNLLKALYLWFMMGWYGVELLNSCDKETSKMLESFANKGSGKNNILAYSGRFYILASLMALISGPFGLVKGLVKAIKYFRKEDKEAA